MAQALTSAAVTPEQLALAWRHLRGRRGCPGTLEAAANHPTWGVCLRALAVNLCRGSRHASRTPGAAAAAAARLGAGGYVPPTPAAPPPGATRAARPGPNPWARMAGLGRIGAHDAKRAAANDFDDE